MITIDMEDGEEIAIEDPHMLQVKSFGGGHYGILVPESCHIYFCPKTRQILTHSWDGLKTFGEEKLEVIQIV